MTSGEGERLRKMSEAERAGIAAAQLRFDTLKPLLRKIVSDDPGRDINKLGHRLHQVLTHYPRTVIVVMRRGAGLQGTLPLESHDYDQVRLALGCRIRRTAGSME